jgi:phospholipid/cholesterol/gamma-HCH transport system substrate-binding protein
MGNQHTKTEVAVGLFVMAGVAALGYLSVSIGGVELIPPDRYVVRARFASVGDLKEGAPVRLAGVKVGEVRSVRLNNYLAEAELAIGHTLELPRDTIASIRSEGLLGDVYISLAPGGDLKNLRDGELLAQTEPATDLMDLLSRYAFGRTGDVSATDPAPVTAPTSEPFSDPLK